MDDLFAMLGIPQDDTRCQWSIGDDVIISDGVNHPCPGIITAIDIPTRRVRVIVEHDGSEHWCYMEHIFRG